MNKYRVYGTTTVTVTKEVWANNEEEAMEKAYEQLSSLTEYCGNGGCDKLVGVAESDESVMAMDDIEYNDTALIEADEDYMECPECGEKMEVLEDDEGNSYWYCDECRMYFDTDGDEIEPIEEDE